MPDEASRHNDAPSGRLLSQLALDDLPEPLAAAVVETLDWLGRLDRELAAGAGRVATRPR